jgi:glycosyltransferase involved in cell wall biosynthesis
MALTHSDHMNKEFFSELSLFTPNYNHGQYLEKKIRQVVDQPLWPSQYIIMDDGSTDNSWDIIQSFSQKYQWIQGIRNKTNKGNTYNLEAAIDKCSGKLFYSTAADDWIMPGAFIYLRNMYHKFPDAGIYFSPMNIMDETGITLSTCIPIGHNKSNFFPKKTFLTQYISKQTARFSLGAATVYNKNCLKQIGGYPSTVGSWRDTLASWIIGIRMGACYINTPLATWRFSSNGNSGKENQSIYQTIDNVVNTTQIMRSPSCKNYFPQNFVMLWAKNYILDTATENLLRLRRDNRLAREKILDYIKLVESAVKQSSIKNFIPSQNLTAWVSKYSKLVSSN